jgi:hypothetical protein
MTTYGVRLDFALALRITSGWVGKATHGPRKGFNPPPQH